MSGQEAVVHVGDCRQLLADHAADSISACVTDPPYELRFMGNRWDDTGAGVDVASWKAVIRVLEPGGLLVAFGHPRTHHRLMCALEQAGFYLHDVLCWLYGTGYPKAESCLKPAWEPIVLARKRGPVRRLDRDGCRVATDWPERSESWKRSGHSAKPEAAKIAAPAGNGIRCHELGRVPPNVLVDLEAALVLDSQAPDSGANRPVRGTEQSESTRFVYNRFAKARAQGPFYGDNGGASRFFPRFRYVPKASTAEREAGLSGGTTPHLALGVQRDKQIKPRANDHPTVKPLELMRWLVRLVTPAGGVVLDPFAGSGSTGMACVIEGMRFVGIELRPAAAEIARKRIAACRRGRREPLGVPPPAPEGQGKLFQ